MKKLLFCCGMLFLINSLFAQETAGTENVSTGKTVPENAAPAENASVVSAAAEPESAVEAAESEKTASEISVAHKPGVSDVPKAKKPKKADSDKLRELDESGEKDEKEKFAETLKYGLEGDIIELLEKLDTKDDVRFTDEIYDLFQDTSNITLKEKILGYFGKLEDPCLEDYAVTILNDPYDEKQSTVDACFSYIQKVKTKEAIPAVLNLLEGEDEKYFNGSLMTIGEIGGKEEAVYLADYLDREDLSLGQKQQLVKVLGKIKAVETYDKLKELAEDKDENSFIRMYSAEAIGSMEKEESVEVLIKLFEDSDPNFRTYVIKGLTYYKDDSRAQKIIIQGTRDAHYKVRLESIASCKKNEIKEAVPYLIYRAKNDPENSVKDAVIPVIAALNTKEGNEYLVKQITDKKVADNPKIKVAKALLKEGHAGTDEIIALARETLKDDRRKPLRYSLGKELAKYKNSDFTDICREYINSKDVATCGTGLDIYNKGKYSGAKADVDALAQKYDPYARSKNANAEKAARILGIKEELDKKADEKKEAEEKKKEEEKKAKETEKQRLEAEKKGREQAAKNSKPGDAK